MAFNQFRRVLSIPNGNPNTWHGNTEGLGGSGLLQPGELGGVLPWDGDQYQLVKMDSGATSATATGVPAAGQLAFWKDRDNYLVTNDSRFADSAHVPAGTISRDHRNSVAGLVESSVLPGEFFFVHQKGNSSVKTSSTPAAGAVFVANTGTDANAVSVAAGTAPTSQVIGVVTSPTAASGKIPARLCIEYLN